MIYRRCVLFRMRGLFSRLKGVSPSKSPAQPGRSLRSPIGHQSLTDVLPCGYFSQWISPTACPLTSSPGELINLISLGVYSLPYVSNRQVLYTMVTRSYHSCVKLPSSILTKKQKCIFLKTTLICYFKKKFLKKSHEKQTFLPSWNK